MDSSSTGAVLEPVPAHVDYVTDGEPIGDGVAFLADVLTDPLTLLLVGLGTAVALAAAAGYLVGGSRIPDIEVARRTLASYTPYLPWMLRLSTGLPLVGAAFTGYYFTPSVPVEARLLQVVLGFLLLFGLATRVVAVAGLVAYLGGLAVFGSELLLASEYLAGFLGLVLLGAGQPSADGSGGWRSRTGPSSTGSRRAAPGRWWHSGASASTADSPPWPSGSASG